MSFTMGGHQGPSERIPRDAGGVTFQAAEGMSFNAEEGRPSGALRADEPRVRRQLPVTMVLLMAAIVGLGWFVGGWPVAIVMALVYLVLGGLVWWVRGG